MLQKSKYKYLCFVNDSPKYCLLSVSPKFSVTYRHFFSQRKSADWNITDTVKLSRLKHQTELSFCDTRLTVLFETEHSTLEVLAEMLDRGK